jgi:uncharacterized protein (DUF2252 family)
MATVEHVTEQTDRTQTAKERAARGTAARAELPRSAHAFWEPGAQRRDPVELLEEQGASRLPDLVPLRYGRMLVSPFTFFRGAAYLMAADLAESPASGLDVQLCGDAHLSNFGAFAAPDRRLVFGVNDFDETLPGPFEWDVKRLAASFAVAGRDRGFDAKARDSVNVTAARAYRKAMRDYAGMGNLDVWYARIEAEDLARAGRQASRKQVERFERKRGQGPVQGPPEGVREAHRGRRRGTADRERPAAHRPDRGRRAGRRASPARRVRT